MTMTNHTRLDLVEGGSIFKQGEHAKLAFNPRDYSGKTVDLTGKDIAVAIWNDKGIMYEGSANFDSTAQLIRLTINQLLQHGDFQIEFTATDAADPDYRQKFPSGEYEGKIYIKPSADNIDFIGVSMTTVAQLRSEQENKQQQFEQQIVPQVDEIKTEQQRLQADYNAAAANLTQDSEVILARGNEPSLPDRLNSSDQRLADTGLEINNTKNLENWELSNKKRKKQAFMSIHDDDGNAQVLTKLLPLSVKYGVPFNLGIIAQNIASTLSGRLTLNDMLMLQNQYGYEMMSHTYTHPHLGEMSEQQQEYELKTSKDLMEANGLKVHGLSFPYRSTNEKTVGIARKYYRYAKSGGNGLNSSPLQTFGLKQVAFGSYINDDPNSPHAAGTLNYYKWLVDQAVEKGEWLIFGFHIAETDDTQLGYLDPVIEYALSRGVEIGTINDGMNRMGNIVDVGNYRDNDLNIPHFALGYDGKISSSDMQSTVIRKDGFNGNTPPNQFLPRKIYYTRMAHSEAIGVPAGAGELVTYTASSQEGDLSVRYQKYKPNGANESWLRTQSSNTEWGVWELENVSIKLPDNSRTASDLRTVYPSNKISYVRINTTAAVNFPTAKAGILITNNVVPVVDYVYQEYHVSYGGGVYRRNATTNGWSDWTLSDSVDDLLLANSITAEKAGNTFVRGKISHCEITPVGIGAFPATGILKTNRLSASVSRIFQELEATESWDIYRRYWIPASSTWSAWKKVSMM